jgi:DNA mismatch endonuclease, patch repair protein
MASVGSRDTVVERAVRRRLWGNGLRFRVQGDLPGRPDIVFSAKKTVVFIDGDFWHGRRPPEANDSDGWQGRWKEKIAKNRTRDEQIDQTLRASGWKVLRYWESDVLQDPDTVARSIAETVTGLDFPCWREIELSLLEKRRRGSLRATYRRPPER